MHISTALQTWLLVPLLYNILPASPSLPGRKGRGGLANSSINKAKLMLAGGGSCSSLSTRISEKKQEEEAKMQSNALPFPHLLDFGM